MGRIALHVAHPHVLVVVRLGGIGWNFLGILGWMLIGIPIAFAIWFVDEDLGDLPRHPRLLVFKDSRAIPGV